MTALAQIAAVTMAPDASWAVTVEHINADYTAGVLTLSIPVHEAAKPRKVSITSQDAKQVTASAAS